MESYAKAGLLPDFRVSYTLYSAEEGGRKTPARQHIRWDFRYDEPAISTSTFMVWPEILLPSGALLIDGVVPTHGLADMFIIFPTSRAFHQQHIKPGLRGYFVEGARRVAVCEVIAILNLHSNPLQ
ncbi:hypothetical protein J0X19_12740 [Hymenobacter sp. BT186]|uniref:Uncharacterized protein n=1 Tax=Hymenobacter telluris TaxID=2816474 RepID=A0A939EX90_9BACT|nr:hypothetical protein [Hymenobacter telluris]MBO0358816.1 hypothetical protein [Hymenobacter telluris]MBW3374842.1 hypothetical protein [Hymenobacter norwichensis]